MPEMQPEVQNQEPLSPGLEGGQQVEGAPITPETAPQESQPIEPQQGEVRQTEAGGYEQYVKIKGVGQWLDPKEIANGFSFNRRNTEEARKLKEERSRLEEERQRLLSQRQASAPAATPAYGAQDYGTYGYDNSVDDPLVRELQTLRQEVTNLKTEQQNLSRKDAMNVGIDALASDPDCEGFDRRLVEAELARMSEADARALEHPRGYKLVWLTLEKRKAKQKSTQPPGPPNQERVTGPRTQPGRQRVKGELKTIEDTARLLEETVPGFKTG